MEAGANPTPVIDRYWFRSVYFREPSGVLFEIATMGPGFTVDEDLGHLGERLVLPPKFEHLRGQLDATLTPIHVPTPVGEQKRPQRSEKGSDRRAVARYSYVAAGVFWEGVGDSVASFRIEVAVIGRVFDQAHRIGLAVLVGVLLTGSAGYTWFDQLGASGSAARAVSQPMVAARPATPVPVAPPTATPTVVLTSPEALAASDKVPFGLARVAPHLEAVDPTTSAIPVFAPIVMAFSQPMERSSVEVTFAIRPSVEGRLAWRDDVSLVFEPFRLAYATTYEVGVAGRSTRGVPLSGRKHWTFTTVAGPAHVLAAGAGWINLPLLPYHYIPINPDRHDPIGFALSATPADFPTPMYWLS